MCVNASRLPSGDAVACGFVEIELSAVAAAAVKPSSVRPSPNTTLGACRVAGPIPWVGCSVYADQQARLDRRAAVL